jgi:hypothetical protein
MEDVRSRAFAVYLQHSLASALVVESVVTQRNKHIGEETVNASAVFVRYCANAQSACGVFGLAAIDRAESMLLYWLKHNCSFAQKDRSNNKNLALKFEKSAGCYSRALARQLSDDVSNATRWSYAGTVYDQADASKLAGVKTHDLQNPDDLSEWKARAREYGRPAGGSKAMHHYAEVSALRAEIALKYHTQIAQSEVILALCAHSAALAYEYSTTHQSATVCAAHLILALDYTLCALECAERGENELQGLWNLCAKYKRAAAANIGTPDVWATACNGLAQLAEKLMPAVRMLNYRSASSSTDFAEGRRRLSGVFQQINDSPWGKDPTSDNAQHFSSNAIDCAIADVTFALERVLSGSVQEHTAIRRFRAAADKVNVWQSPAHPHIKQCWLSAAEQISLAVAATTEIECKRHQQRSVVLQRLVLGPLATAADYFVKADLAVSPQAKDLWRQAAQLSLTTVVAVIQCCYLHVKVEEGDEADFTFGAAESMQRTRQLAEAAACCEQADANPADSTAATVELQKAELQLRLTVLEWDAVVPHDSRACWGGCDLLLEWCVQRTRTAIGAPPGVPPVGAQQQQEAQQSAHIRTARAAWLCAIMARVVRAFAAPCVAGELPSSSYLIMHSLTAFQRQVVDEAAILADPLYSTLMDSAVESLEESQRQIEQSGRVKATKEEQDVSRLSAEQFRRCAEYTAVGAVRKYIQQHSEDGDTCLEKGVNARQAGRWYAAAAQAAATEQREACSAFAMAGKLTGERSIDVPKKAESNAERENWAKVRPVIIRAGERFAKAAEALQAGDRELYEMWMQAARATARAVSGPLVRARGDPEVLAQTAQQRQDAMDAAKGHGGCKSRSGQECKQDSQEDGTCVVM